MKALLLLILFSTQMFGATSSTTRVAGAPDASAPHALSVADLKAHRFVELTEILNKHFASGQTLDALKEYVEVDYKKLQALPLDKFDVATWKDILKDIPVSMDTGASNPAKLGKAIAHIEQYLG